MPSPFSGMNPYLESSHIWEDFHSRLAAEISDQLTPDLRPKYVATLATRITYETVEYDRAAYDLAPGLQRATTPARPVA
jgi:hypothetical protein